MRKFKPENWFMFVDAREDENLSHEEAINLLKKNGVSDEEIFEILKEYDSFIEFSLYDE